MWSFKNETDFYFRNINQKLREDCAQCTKVKRKVNKSENKEEIKMYAKQNKKNIKIIDIKQILKINQIVKQEVEITKALKATSKSFSTREILGIDVETYKKWIEWQMTPELNWTTIELEHVKPICMFDVSKDEDLKQAYNWQNTQRYRKIFINKKELSLIS